MADISTTIPAQLRAGDTAKWRRILPDYPASAGWALHYKLLPQSGAMITIDATADGDNHLINVVAANTAAWLPGIYRMQEYITKAPDQYTLSTTVVQVLLNIATQAAGLDTRTHARKVLDALEAFLEGKSVPNMKIEIAGRLIQNHPIPELLILRDRYRVEAAREEAAAAGKIIGGRVLTRFTR
jgi:hypothetical protein